MTTMVPPTKKTETRNLRMHPKLLLDVIQRQAGTLSKAILEGVMNAADAKATKVEVNLTPTKLTIRDDGAGFPSREAITQFFEVFGLPHDEKEGKIYGTFRMGRGQLFAFGANTWSTNAHRMIVDIQGRGLEYDLVDLEGEEHPGCTIEVKLYEKLLPSGLAETERDISMWTKYAPLQVYFNGTLVSKDPAKEKWTHDTPEAYIRLREGGTLSVYNLGIHVLEYPGYRYGTGGVVVSKQQLRVNFARNDIQSTCPVWRKISPKLNAMAADANKKRTVLDDDARQRIVDRILQDEADADEYSRPGVITLVNGKQISFEKLMRDAYQKAVTVTTKGDRIGGLIQDAGTAIVLSTETLDRFHEENLQAFAKVFDRVATRRFTYHREMKTESFTKLAKAYDSEHLLVPEKDWSPREKAWIDLMNRNAPNACRAGGEVNYNARRKIILGESKTADGWTDGETFVAISRTWLKHREMTPEGFAEVALLLVHEYTHGSSNVAGCDHDLVFFEDYHENARRYVPSTVTGMISKMAQIMEMHNRRLTKRQLKSADQLAKGANAEANANEALRTEERA